MPLISGSSTGLGLPLFFWVIVAAVFGLVLGSFAGLVVYRLPRRLMGLSEESLMSPPSHCITCGQTLRCWHNIPVLSHLMLRGRCGFCGVPIGRLSLWCELAYGSMWSSMVWIYGPTPSALAWAIFFSVLCVLAVIDWQTMLLPDVLTLPLIGIGCAAAWANWTPLPWIDSVLGAAVGFLMLWLASLLFVRLRGYSGMGGGDPKLMAALGAWFGMSDLIHLLLISSLLHVFLVRLSLRFVPPSVDSDVNSDGDDEVPNGAVPMGPPMAMAAVLNWLIGFGSS